MGFQACLGVPPLPSRTVPFDKTGMTHMLQTMSVPLCFHVCVMLLLTHFASV